MILRFALGHFPAKSQICHTTIQANDKNASEDARIPTINEIQNEWNKYSENIKANISAGQTYYYSFLSVMKIPQAKSILEVGCGNGSLIPLAIMLKKQETNYLATDLVQNMVQNAKNNLKQNFSKYYSKFTFEQWCEKQNLSFIAANGEDIISPHIKFDRIICNFVLMITQNPEKMLKSLYDQAQSGCLLGVSVWGDPQKNPYLQYITQIIKQEGDETAHRRSEFYLYNKVAKIAEKEGWETIIQWQQNALLPILSFNFEQNHFGKSLDFWMNLLPENKRDIARKKITTKASDLIKSNEGIKLSNQLYLFRKP